MIEGAKATLRPLSDSDIEVISRWEADQHIATAGVCGSRRHLTVDEEYRRVARSRTSRMFGIGAEDGALIGDIGLVEISWRRSEAELVVRIGDERYLGKGYGRDAIRALLDYAFTTVKLDRVYLRVFADNAPALKCFGKCGFRKEWTLTLRPEEGGPPRKVFLMMLQRKDFLGRARCEEAS